MDAGLEGKLRERLGDRMEPRLAALDAEFGGLLDRPARVLLLADEEGLIPAQAGLEGFADGGRPALQDVEGVLERLSATRTFRRGDGTVGFVADAEVAARTGTVRVVLWDEAVRRAQGRLGMAVRVTALVPKARGGETQLHSTRATEVVPAGGAAPSAPS